MKILLLTILFTLLFSQNIEKFAQENNYETDYKVAIQKAKKEHKDVMLVLVTEHCPWCKKLERETLSDNDVKKEVNKQYIPLILNRQKRMFPDRFYSSFVPAMHFINYKNEEYFVTELGFRNKNDFLEYLK